MSKLQELWKKITSKAKNVWSGVTYFRGDVLIDGNLYIRTGKSGGISFVPLASDEYVFLKWLNQDAESQSHMTAGLVAHELKTGTNDVHNHLSVYLAGENYKVDPKDRASCIDMTFGRKQRVVSLENTSLMPKKAGGQVLIRDKNNKFYELIVENGKVIPIPTTISSDLVKEG